MPLSIRPYTPGDSEQAIALERTCPQGGALTLTFRRPTFHARSSVYQESVILCARTGDQIVGIAAGARKRVQLHGSLIHATYGFDLRVHPDHRSFGTARLLAGSVIEALGASECVYSLVAGMNERAFNFTRRTFGARSIIPLTYLILPVLRHRHGDGACRPASPTDVRISCLSAQAPFEFVPDVDPLYLHGQVGAFTTPSRDAGAAVWRNDDLLQEEIVRLPWSLRCLSVAGRVLSPLNLLPSIPGPGEAIRSWFLHDVYAHSPLSLRQLLRGIIEAARSADRTLVYLLLPSHDPLCDMLIATGIRHFRIPYTFLAKGTAVPNSGDHLYIDIRDL